MNRTEKFMKNTIATALLQVITMMAGFILPKVMLTVYGSGINGLVSSITQLISYLTLVEAGLSGATVYSLYKPLTNNDKNQINRVLAAAKKFYYRTGYLFLGLVVGIALIYPLLIETKILSYFEILFLFIILGVNGVLEFFTLAKYRALLTADQKTYVISLASIVQVIFNVVIISGLSYFNISIVIVRFIAIVGILMRTIILWLYCNRKYNYLDFSVEPDNSSMDKRWDALYMQIIGVINTGTPVMIATFMLTLNDVSIYTIYNTVIIGINAVLGIFTNGLSASFGDLIIRGEREKFIKAFKQFEYIYYILITIIFSIMFRAYLPFIKVYTLGADINYSYVTLALLMTINGYLYNLKVPFGMLTTASGKYRESRVQITIQGILQIVSGIFLSKIWGLNGVIMGAIISNLYRDIDFIFFAPKYLTNYSFSSSLKMWIRSISVLGVIFMFTYFIPTDFITGYGSWLKYSCIIGVIAVVITLAINISTNYKMFDEVRLRLKSMLK